MKTCISTNFPRSTGFLSRYYKNMQTDKQTYPQFSICRNGTRTQLITVTKQGRFGDVMATVLTGFEGNIREALNACERGETDEAIRIFTNKP